MDDTNIKGKTERLRRMRRALAWTLALLVIPTTVAQGPPVPGHVLYCSRDCLPHDINDDNRTNVPINVVLYAHIFDALQRAPLNVIPPDLGREPDVNAGFMTPTLKVEKEVLWFDNNGFTLFHMPTFTKFEGDGLNQDGPLAYPLKVGADGGRLFWYLSPHAVPQSNSSATAIGSLGAMPLVTVKVRVETGRHPGYGTLIASGSSSTPAVLGLPASDYVYEFEVPLEFVLKEIPPDEGFVVHVSWSQYGENGAQVAQSDWRIRSGPRFAPRLILSVENPLMLSEVNSIYRAGTHYLVTDITSLFGAYDLNPFSLNMSFHSGPMDTAKPTPIYYFPNSKVPHTIRVVWAIPTGEADRPSLIAGTYLFDLRVSNLWGTYEMREQVPLDIFQFTTAKRSADGAPVAFALLALAAVVFVAGRRHN
jgi:hypothetical protein